MSDRQTPSDQLREDERAWLKRYEDASDATEADYVAADALDLFATRLSEAREEIADCPVCPKCGKGRNSRAEGGNVKCFHCSACGFIDCETTWEDALAKAVQAEREACAKVAEGERVEVIGIGDTAYNNACKHIAAAIRQRREDTDHE